MATQAATERAADSNGQADAAGLAAALETEMAAEAGPPPAGAPEANSAEAMADESLNGDASAGAEGMAKCPLNLLPVNLFS